MSEIEIVKKREQQGIYNKYLMTCISCFSAEKGVEVSEAERLIKAPRTAGHIARCERYQYAKENIHQFFKVEE